MPSCPMDWSWTEGGFDCWKIYLIFASLFLNTIFRIKIDMEKYRHPKLKTVYYIIDQIYNFFFHLNDWVSKNQKDYLKIEPSELRLP